MYGHVNIQITQNYYLELIPEKKHQQDADALNLLSRRFLTHLILLIISIYCESPYPIVGNRSNKLLTNSDVGNSIFLEIYFITALFSFNISDDFS